MHRRAFLSTVALGLLAAPLAAEAQAAGKVWRIGVLWFTFPSVSAPFFEALRQGMRERGYIEGQHMAFEQRWAERRPERYSELVAELVSIKVDVIVAGNLESSLAAKQATSTIPIILTAGGDPVRAGLVASLARPGGNITGMSEPGPDLAPKLVQLLKEAVPRLTRVAILWNPANPSFAPTRHEIASTAQAMGVNLLSLEVGSPREFEAERRQVRYRIMNAMSPTTAATAWRRPRRDARSGYPSPWARARPSWPMMTTVSPDTGTPPGATPEGVPSRAADCLCLRNGIVRASGDTARAPQAQEARMTLVRRIALQLQGRHARGGPRGPDPTSVA